MRIICTSHSTQQQSLCSRSYLIHRSSLPMPGYPVLLACPLTLQPSAQCLPLLQTQMDQMHLLLLYLSLSSPHFARLLCVSPLFSFPSIPPLTPLPVIA